MEKDANFHANLNVLQSMRNQFLEFHNTGFVIFMYSSGLIKSFKSTITIEKILPLV